MKKELSAAQISELLGILKARFEKNMHRHEGLLWNDIQSRLEANYDKLWSLNEMEFTGGEPDVIGTDQGSGAYIFVDCAIESPKGRRSYCYDKQALDARKENKPANNAMDVASAMGVNILNESEYRNLQQLGNFDNKTSSWLITPPAIRKLGGAIFGDFRYNTVFIYHNGAESYYAARGFRASLHV